jgi:hypothetical protein
MQATPPPAIVLPAPVRDVRGFGAYLLDQGETNACGTTSLAMILDFWAGHAGACPRTQIDAEIRRAEVGTSPTRLVGWARAHGLRAAATNHAGWEGLRPWLDRGVPVQLLVENGAAAGAGHLHFVVALGYTCDATGGLATLQLADPHPIAGLGLREISAAELDWRWRDLRLGCVSTGQDRAMAVYLPQPAVRVIGRNDRPSPTDAFELAQDAGFDWRAGVGDAYFGFYNAMGRFAPPAPL